MQDQSLELWLQHSPEGSMEASLPAASATHAASPPKSVLLALDKVSKSAWGCATHAASPPKCVLLALDKVSRYVWDCAMAADTQRSMQRQLTRIRTQLIHAQEESQLAQEQVGGVLDRHVMTCKEWCLPSCWMPL